MLLTQIKAVEAERDALIVQETPATPKEATALLGIRGIGPEFATILYTEGLFRHFDNRRQIASYAGLAPRHMRDMQAQTLGDLVGTVRFRSLATRATLNERPIIVTQHTLHSKEIGMVRIYMKPREKTPGKGGWFGSKPLYRELVLQAEAAGIMNAVAHHTHFGYSNSGMLQDEGFEIPNPDLTMCVELIAARDKLEDFCRTHGAFLKNKMIVYKHLEHWDVDFDKEIESSRQEI